MSVILLTYDIKEGNPDKHTEIKETLIKNHGFRGDFPMLGSRSSVLPNTTLWTQYGSVNNAITALELVCKEKGAILESVFATKFNLQEANGRNY